MPISMLDNVREAERFMATERREYTYLHAQTRFIYRIE